MHFLKVRGQFVKKTSLGLDKTGRGRHIFRHVTTFTVIFGEKSSTFQQTGQTSSTAGLGKKRKSAFHQDLENFVVKGLLKCEMLYIFFRVLHLAYCYLRIFKRVLNPLADPQQCVGLWQCPQYP